MKLNKFTNFFILSTFIFSTFSCSNSIKEDRNTQWKYEQYKSNLFNDDVTDAIKESSNSVKVTIPSEQDAFATLTLRKDGYGQIVLLNISAGKFYIDPQYGYIDVTFDNEKPLAFPIIDSYLGKSESLIAIERGEQSNAFIDKFKKTKKASIKLHLYNDGENTFVFNVDDLKWD